MDELTDKAVLKDRWHMRGWSDVLVVMLGTMALGLLWGIVLGGLVFWLGRWRRLKTVAIWLLIPCLFLTWIVVQSTRRQTLHDQVAARFTSSAVPAEQESTADAFKGLMPASELVTRTISDTQPSANSGAVSERVGWSDERHTEQAVTSQVLPVQLPMTWATRRWNADVARLIADFPVIAFGNNPGVFQEKLNLLYTPGRSNRQKLEAAYAAAIADGRWDQPPLVDRAAEDAKWNVEATAFVQAHPSLRNPQNAKVLQENLEALHQPNLTNLQMLQLAYQILVADPNWVGPT